MSCQGVIKVVDDAAFEQLPRSLRQQSIFERCHLHKLEIFQNRARDPAFDPKYFPQNSGVVRLPCYWIQRRHLYVFGEEALNRRTARTDLSRTADSEKLEGPG